jgi:hypothetical protein
MTQLLVWHNLNAGIMDTIPYLVRADLEKSGGVRYGITGYFQPERLSRENISICHVDWNDGDG